MNAIYKVIWNDAIRQYQVVNELCRSRRKACSVKAVHTDGAGRSLKRSVLATAAATLIGSAAILGVPGSVWADDFNLGDYAPDIEINIGTGAVNNGEPPKVDFSLLPGSNETIYINQSAFTGFASNIFNQEERTPPLYLLETTDSGAMVSDINLSILGADGQPLDLTNNHLGTTGTADFYYTFDNTRIVDGFLYVYRTLNRIDLTSQAGYGQVFDVSDSKGADLKAAITGEGNITFSYNSTGEGGDPGHLTLSNPDNANAYTGRTFVGYNSQGDESSPVNIYFGKDGALGSTIGTEQLQIAAQSAVHFGGENDNEAYTQTVRGLSGSGLLHLGTQATLTLNQSSSDTGLVPDGAGQIIISNRYAGSGTYNAANGSYSGSVFNVNLSDEVAGYELVFTDTASDYTGLINLTNAAVTAYDKDRTVKDDETGTEYTPNALLESATLQLQSGSHLKVTDKGSVHNLIIADENTSIVFDNLDLGTGILEIDNLSLQNTGKVEIDNIGSGLQGAADELGYLEADGGITQEIIRVSGTIVGDGNDMVLAGDALQEKQTELSTDDVEADLYWNFDPNLIFNDKDKTYSAKYGLTKVNVESGQFVLEAKEGATEATADFTAQITGSGGLRIDASGTTVTLGNTEQGAPANSYSGATTVTSGTDVILAVDNAMGNTSSLDADGNVTLDENVDQTIKGLTGSGMLTLEDGSVLTLAQSGDAILDNVLSGNGTFRVSGTGTDKTNVVFNKEFGYDGAFDFSNTVFDLDEGHNRDAAASADFNLSNSVLHLGESGGTFGNMVVNDGVQFDSTYLVIGSDTAALAGTGSLTFNSNTNIKLEGISVADDIALIDFDENTRYQDFITASRGITGSGNVTLQGQNLASFTGSYTQNGTKVANTTWVVSSDLQKNGSDSLQAGALLTGIELTGGELVISGAGTLAALVTQADDAQNAAIRFSLADGALSSSMTVSNTNDFTAAVSVDGGVKLSLAANNALGTTSGLTVAGTAEVALNNGVSQTVGGLEGTGAVLLGSGSDFTLSQNGAASLETAVTGGANSTFTVNLGNSNNALTFENQTGYNGKFVLQDAHLQFADNSNAEAVLGGSNFVLDDGAVFDLQSGTAGTLSGLVFDGGTLGTHQTTLADAGNAQLNVSGDVSLDESSKIEAGGITLTGASDVLRADNAGGVRQVFIQYTGEFNSGNGAQLSIDGDALASSDIFNEGDPDTVVAHGTWSGSVGVDEAGKEIYGNLQLTQIDLIGSGDGLILNAAEASDSTLSALVTGSGNLTLAGDLTISGSAPNTYTGETAVTSGTVKLGMDSGFGNTSKLEIWSNAAVDFGAHSQTVGSLEIGNTQLGTTDALRGTGTLTLASGGNSEIWGTNNFGGTIVLGSGHDLAINNASGIGASAKVGFSAADSVLTIEGAKSGTFGTELLGSGTVVIRDSSIAVADGNTNFTGRWELESNAGVTVSDNVDAVLGTGAVVALDGTLTLGFASNSATDVTIDEKLSGSGSLVLTGNSNQKFGLAQSGSNFSGTVTLDKISMTVGGSGTGTNNANAFKTADLVLQGGSVLEVATGSTVTTFDKVSVNNGQTAGFKFGGLGFNSDGTTATGTSALVINELVNNGAAQITLDALGTNGDLLGAVAETSLVNGGVDVFQALIQTGKVMDESILNNFTLTGVGTGQATQEIKSVTEPVATGYYDFDLALGDSGTDLGVSYDLTRIDISDGKTLTLYEEGTLDAQLTSESGSGNLTIAAGGKIILANDSANALNSYTGVTNVLGTLTAHAGNLGSTSELQIGAGGHYVNAGDNKVGLLDADGTLELSEGYTLEITQGADKISNIAGTLTGGGDLSFAAGELTVSGSSSSNYDGTVYVGSANSEAVLTISGAGALGTGSIVLGTHSGSAVNIYGTEGQTFVNEISGSGTINVDLSGGAFAFGTEQLGLSTGSTLVLDGATFDLISSDVNFNDDVAGKLAIELTDGSKLINDGSADKDVYSLTLNGGTIDLGEINTEFGQINLVSEEGTLNIINKTTIDIASQSDDNVTESGDRTITDGSELLTGGVFYLDIFTGVKNLNGIENLVLEQGFSGTTEKLLQDADPDSEGLELVANMTRDDGTFEYDGSKVYLEYRFKEIELLREELNQGLLVDAEQKPGGTLSAKITGDGNLKLDGTLNLGVAGTVNDYTGITYVLGDGVVTIQADSAFGQTKDLDIATGGVVKLNGFDQTVGALSGTGKLEFASGSDFKLDNYLDKEGAQSIDINNELVGAAGSTFTIDGTYGTGENDHASVSFGRENNLGGMTFTLRNAKFDIGGTGDFDYLTSRSANDFVLSTGAAVTVNGTSGNLYDYNELSFAGGSLDVTNVTLVKEGTGASTAAVIETNRLDLNGNGTLSVAAKIDSSFDVLADDQANFVSTLIKYGELDGNKSNLKPSTTFSSSAIEQGGTNVAYVNWDGDITVDESAKTVGMSYRVAAIQLADETGDGLKLSTGNTAGVDAALDALVTDYGTHAGNITFDGGRITIGSGTVDEKANTYTGTTNVRSNSTVTLAKDGAFGRTDLLNISNGQVNFNGKSETLGSINVGSSGSITGAGSVTLGIAGYDEKSSTILGEHSGFTADVTLANGHTLTLNDTIGIGSSGTIKLESGTDLVINDEAGGNFTKTVSGADSAEILLSGKAIGIFADNSNYLGNWTLTDGTTVSVNGSGNVGVDAILGAGGTVALGNTGALTLSQDSGSISVDNVFAGAGDLVVTGTKGQTFDFSRKWSGAEASGFTGTLSLKGGIQMTVGGLDDSSGANNAANLAYADFNLGSASTLNVALQDSIVDTFDVLNVSGGTISFAGKFGLGATTEKLGQLKVGSLTGSGNIALAIPDSSGTVDQTIGQNDLLTVDDGSHFQALITAESGTVSENGWTLNGNTDTSGSGLRQAVRNANGTDTVAHAIYDYALATGEANSANDSQNDSLGIEYKLTTADILSGKTLELSADSGNLSAVITDSADAGTLLITGQIELTGTNNYESVTRVSGDKASLTVEQSGLGNTTALLLEGNVAFINEGTNSVGYLNASGSNIELNEALTLTGGNVSEIVGGTISGTHALNVQKNQLQVSGNINAKDFSGDVNLGDGNSGAILELDGVAGIGTGSVNFVTGTSSVYVKGTTGTSLTNTYSGGGKIAVNLGGSTNVFDFSVTQAKNGASGSFTGELVLEKAGYHLYDDEGELASATLVTSGGGYVTVNAGSDIANHKVDGLSLYGGTLDFGLMTEGSESGQIVVGSDGFATNASKTVVKVALGENNNATGSDVFDLNSDLSVLLIKGFNASGRDLDSLDFSGSAEVDQLVKQSGRYADGSATAELTYSSGHLVGDESGISAAWDLSKINLLAGNEEGFRIDASAETGQSGTISAYITGEGSIEFAGGTITLNHANDYTGSTNVTGGELVLAVNEALGNTKVLDISSGNVAIGGTTQTIGAIEVDAAGHFTMGGAGKLVLSDDSYINSANTGVTGTIQLSGAGSELTLRDMQAAGAVPGSSVYQPNSRGATIELGEGTSVILAFGDRSGGNSDEVYNRLTGSGTVQIGDGDNDAYVELSNFDNHFGTLLVKNNSAVLVNDMHSGNGSINGSKVVVEKGGLARLFGNKNWTFTNDLDLKAGGELVISAGGTGGNYNTVQFAGSVDQQIDIGGTVSLQTTHLYLGGKEGVQADIDNGGINNAKVLTNANVNVGGGAYLHVEDDSEAQSLNGLTLGNNSHLVFEGNLGVSDTPTTELGQLKVGSLDVVKGSTIHLTASDAPGTGGKIADDNLLAVAHSGSFQSLITVTGEGKTITDGELANAALVVEGSGTVVSEIKDGLETVAEGTFGFGEHLVATSDGKQAGVKYQLELINLLKDKTLHLTGAEDEYLDVQISGSGNLSVTGELTLQNRDGKTNEYTGKTSVEAAGDLIAEAGALGTSGMHTSDLLVSGAFTNAGNNTVGRIDLTGNADLSDETTLTVAGTGAESVISGKLTGSGDMALEMGGMTVTSANSGYNGDVVLGKEGVAATSLTLKAGASLGNGTIRFNGKDVTLNVEASGATELSNALDLAELGGKIVVTGDGDDSFAFRSNQSSDAFRAANTSLSLTGTNYDFTAGGNDVLKNVAFSLNGGKLTVNSVDDVNDRLVNGLTIGTAGAVIDFGQIGNGKGVLNLQGKTFEVDGATTVKLDSKLANADDANGSAAFEGNPFGSVLTLVTGADDISDEDLQNLQEGFGSDVTRDLYQSGSNVAKVIGTFGDFSVSSAENGTENLNVGLDFNELQIQDQQTYTVSTTGEIALRITDSGTGNLTVTGDETILTLSNTNTYSGVTSVESDAQLKLAADNALGDTKDLQTAAGTSVDFGATNQTVGSIHSSGELLSDASATDKTLTVESGGTVKGSNSYFHMDWALRSGDLTIDNVDALGTGAASVAGNANIVIDAATGDFDNELTGDGALSITNGADVALTGSNALTGGLSVSEDSLVKASGDIDSHIGKGDIALAGKAEFTLTEGTDAANWTWKRNLTGSGELTLAREGSNDQTLLFAENSLSGFTGTVALDDWTIELNENADNGTLAEFAKWKTGTLVLRDGANAEVTGIADLGNKVFALGSGGILTINGFGVPGSSSESSHLNTKTLDLSEGFVINLDTGGQTVDSNSILTQDDIDDMHTTVATTDELITLVSGYVSVNGGTPGENIKFDISQTGSVESESGNVAKGIYDYTIGTADDGTDLVVNYYLEGIEINSDKTLVLAGVADDEYGNDSGSRLDVYLTGEGNLRIADNTVRLSETSRGNNYSGTTTVTSGATLYAEEGTLGQEGKPGQTARLTTEAGASTYIEGDNTVRGFTLASGGQLAIGSTDSMSGDSDVTLTIISSTDKNTSTDQINHLYGDLHGHGDLKVVGNGQVDEGVAADLTIHGSQTSFYGDLVLWSGAWVDIAATDSSLFGNSSAGNKVVVYKDSLLTIESERSGDASFYGVFTDGEDGSGGGTVEISLLNTSDHFRFAAAQSDADFTGTFVLNSGTIDFTDLFTSTSGSGDPLAGATLVLNDGGVVDLVGDGSGTSASNERNLGGLTMAGGTIEAGAIGYKAGEGAFNSTINLGGSGALTLERATGAAGDRQSTVVLGTTDDAIQISDSGSEILNAGSVGANVTVISGIGDLVLVNGDKSETVSGSKVIDSDYLHAERPANGTAQEIEQKVILANGSSEYRSVAETVRTYDENFTYNSESGTLSIGYKVSDLGLLYETGNVSSSNYAEDSRWQGLTITANAAADATSVFDALIKNGENGSAAGNIVFKGADGKGTITLAGDENTYTGKTWLTGNAQVVFDTDSGFGNTAALRVDSGSSVDFAGHDQSMGALFALGDDALKSTDGANLAVNGTAIINGANDNLHADWTFSGSVTIGDELSLGHGAVELAGSTTTLTISGSEANGTIGNAITGGELTNIYVTSGANVSFANADILSGPNFTGNIAVWSGASAGFAIESGATVSNGLTIGSTGKVSFESTSGGTLAFEDANIYGTLELNNVTFDLDAHGDAFNRGSSLVANAGTRIDVSDAVSGAVSNITLNSGSTVAFDNGTPGAAGEGEVASINLGSSGTLTLAGDVTVDLDINDYADASDVEDAQGDLINRPLTAQDLTGQDGGAVLATLIAGQVSSDTADLNLKTDGNDVEENKLNIAIRNAANGEEVATGTYDYKLVLDKDGSGSGLKLSYGLTEVTIRDGKTLELTGTSADEDDNELTAALKGTGNLRITEGEVTLVDKDSDYTGSTSVAAGAALVAGSAGHTLGQTSELRLEGATGVVSGASATILGEETVYGLNVQLGATLNLVAGSGEGAGAVLTVAGGEDDNVIAGNDALGQGGGKLAVSGDGTKLTVEGANSQFTGITSVESGAVLSAGNTASLGTGNTEIAAGGTLEVVAAVDATSGASRVVSQITNSVTGAGDVVINLSGTAQANQKMFRFADDQTSGFSGNIVLENGGYSLAYANDGDAETDYTANQLAAMNSRISVEENGHLYVSTVDHQINRYIDKHVRALTLDGGNIYFGGLRYDMTSMDESLGGQLQLAGDTDKSATLEIKSESLVNLDAGATNTLTDGSELLIADEGAKIDLIQNAADVALGSGADTIWASSSDEADFTDLLNDYLKLNTVNSDAEQTLTQDGRDVAIVTRGFGSSGHDEVFGVEQNDSSAWDLYLNYHVSKIELIDSENKQGLLITNDEAGSYSDLTALVTGSGNLTLSGVSGTTIALGDGSAATQNDYTGRTTVTGSVTVKAAEDNAFGNTYRLNVESGAKVDFGKFDQTLGILEARGDDALAGTADSVVTITDDMIVTGKNDDFHSQVRLEFSGTGTVSDVGGLGTGDISIGKDYTLVIADENESDGNRVGNNITGSGTVVIGRDDATGTIELGGKNAGFTGNVRVESDWTLEASMGKGETTADRIGSGNLVLSNGATGSFTQTEGNLDWTSAVIGEGDLVLSAGKDSDVTISGGLDYFNGDITIDGGRFELASGNGNVENVDGSNLHATGEDTTVVVADQGTVILGDDLSVESGASIVFEGDVTPGTIGDAQLVVAGDLTITESNVTINVGGELDPGDPDTASLNVQDVTSADRSDELALVIAEADNIVLSGNDLVVLGPDGNPINNPEDRLGVSIVDGEEEIATGYYDFGLTSSESGGRDILGVGYRLMEVNVKDGKTLVLNGAHAADVDYENASSFDADITGNGNFALANGELTLTGKNTYTGSTLVGDGTSETTLTVDRGSSLGDTSTVNVSDNATLVNRSDLTDAGSIQVASGGTVTLEDGSVFTVTDVANESNIAGTLTGSGALHLNDNVDIDVAADKAQNFTGIVSVGSGAVYNLLSNVTDTVTVASRFESDSGDDAVVGMTGDFSLEAKNTAYHGAFVLSDGTVIRTNSIASLGAADATITTAGDYAEAGGTASQADDNATVILDYADRETVGDVTQTMTSGITFVKTGDGVVELSAESLGAGAVKSSEGGIIFGAAGDSTVYGTALTVEGGAWAAGFGGVGSLSVASDGAFYLGGVDGYNSIVSSGWTSSEGSSTVQFTVSGNVTNNGTIYVGNKNSSGDTPADSNYIGNELVIEGDYITDGGTLDLNAIIAGKDNSKSDHVTIKGEIDGTGFIDVNYDSSVSTGGELEYLGLVSVAEGESGDSLKLKDSIKIGDLYYRLMWSSEQNEYYLQSSVTDPGDDPWNTEDVENIHAGTRSALAFMQAQAFDLSLRGHLGETLYVDPVTGEQRKSSFWMVQRGDWTKFSNASGQMNADGNLYTTHLGTDLFKRETDGATFRWGVLAGFADGDFDVSSNVDGKSSKGSFRGYSAGLYMTAESKAESGPFLGLQLRWNRFDNEVGPDDYDVNGLSLTAEASWDQLLSKGLTDGGRHYEWRLEPHVRAYWTNFSDPGNWTSRLGETYSSDFDNGLLVRVGARTKIQTTLGTGPAWQAYAEANWVYNNGDYSTTMSTQYGDVTSTQNGAEFAEFRLGLEAQFTTNVNVWLEGHHQTGSDDYESTGAMFGFKYMW